MTTEIETENSTMPRPDPGTEAVRRLFRRARKRPRADREAWVRANARDEGVASEVVSLLAHLDDIEADAPPADILLGQAFAGWTLLEIVGEGGSGRVYLAERDGVRGAFKLLHAKHSGTDGKAGHRVRIERSALERLSHPAIVRLLDHGTVEIAGTARDYLVTEFVEDAEPLFEGAMRERLSVERRVQLLIDIAEAVGHAHAAGVVHRDLKPENIALDGEGRPRILDFGIARVEATNPEDRDARAGSRSTLAPEQVDPRIAPISPRTDVYSLGVIGCRLLTGDWPYDVGDRISTAIQATLHVPPFDLSAVNPPLPIRSQSAVMAALAKSPAARPADAAAFANLLGRRSVSSTLATGVPAGVRPGTALVMATAIAFVGFVGTRTLAPSSGQTTTPPTLTGESDMRKEVWATIASLMTSASIASADVPTLNPIKVFEIPGVPSSLHVTMCGDDIVFLRMSDRAVRILREAPVGTWSEFGLPDQVPPSSGNVPMLFGRGDCLAVVESNASTSLDRIVFYRRNPAGNWGFVQTVSAPSVGSFSYLTDGDWSGSTFIVGDRNADQYRGAAYVYETDASGQWHQAAKLQGSLATPFYTEVSRVAIEGNVAVLGHWLNPCGYGAPSGRIHVFRRSGSGVWSEEAAIRPAWATCGDQFANAAYLAHGRVLNLWGPTLSGFKQQFSISGGQWQQLPDFAIPGADIDTALPLRTDFGMFLMSQPTGVAWALRKTTNSFEPIAKLAPANRFAQSGVAVHIGAHGNRMATRLRIGTSSYGICLYDVTPLLDCDNDGVPNADEIAAGAPDCDGSGIPDSCEGSGEYVSPSKAPFGTGQNLSHAFTSLPNAAQEVSLTVEAKADLGGVSEFVTVKADGTTLTTLFAIDGQDCPASAQSRTVSIPAAQFNGFLADGAVTIELIPSSLVSVKECPTSTARVRLVYPEQIIDCDGNGQYDACQIAANPGLDKDSDGTLDGCNYAKGDFDLSDTIDGGDLAYLLALWGATNPPVGDLNGDAVVSAPDLGVLLANWGPITP